MQLASKGRSLSVDTTTLISGFKMRQLQGFKNSFPTRKQSDEVVKGFLLRQDKKALLSVGLLTFIAFLCWTPYFVLVLDILFARLIHNYVKVYNKLMLLVFYIVRNLNTLSMFL
jgi:hypothetical protein